MSTPRILIISPRAEAIERLRVALEQVGFDRPPDVVSEPPAKPDVADDPEPPQAVLIDLSGGASSFNMLRQARRTFPHAVAVAVSGPRRLSAVVQARQAGAWGYLSEPFDMAPLAERLGVNASPRSSPKPRPGAMAAFVPAQGGNGASTVAMHAAYAISERLGGRTLLVDFDLHTGTVAFQLGLAPRTSLADVFVSPENVGSLDWAPEKWRSLHILVGPHDPQTIDASSLADAGQVFEFMKMRYSVVIADLPPALGASSVRALEVADLYYIVCTPEITSLHLARRKIDLLKARGLDLDRMRVLVNRVGSDHSLDNRTIERIVGWPIEWAIDNDYEAVRRAAWEGGLVQSPSALAEQTQQLGLEIVKDLKLEERAAPRSRTTTAEAAPTPTTTVGS